MTTLSDIRKYRIKLDDVNLINSNNVGIAIFDLTGTFIIAYILDYFFNISRIFNGYTKNPKLTYYLILIPLGVLIHLLTLKKDTFFNSKLFSSDINIYKLIFVVLIVMIVNQFNII
jgi:hypothetical protein